ncbi:MAG: lactate racemase domain-containing protein [Candidatus Thorarchaeota archaeon]
MSVAYGDGVFELDIPEKNLAGFIVPQKIKVIPDADKALNRVLDNPHGPQLNELVKSKSVCVLVEDHTRDAPHWELINAIVPRLQDASLVQFIITTGSHEVNHPGNLEIVNMIERVSADTRLDNFRININDCKSSNTVNLGKTSRGTPVVVNEAGVGHDVYISLSDMKAHYFAGYSNALKNFLPGMSEFSAIEANHAMALDPKSTFGRHPYHPNPNKRDNPLADDMREAMEIVTKNAKVFALSVVSSNRSLVWADAGQLEPVISGGIEFLDETSSFKVDSSNRIVVSPGGYPQDKSLYHAQRAIELTKNAVSDGGQVLFMAECRDGVAPESAIENFFNKLKAPLDDVLSSISDQYHLYEHKAYKFAELIKRVPRVRMYTQLDLNTVESAHLEKVNDPQSVIDEWIAEDSSVKILVLDQGNKIAVYAN